jgi:hypothetical protein
LKWRSINWIVPANYWQSHAVPAALNRNPLAPEFVVSGAKKQKTTNFSDCLIKM